ncbi:MAG: CCA tRNA nucleotidyltransferase [Geminicoccaceae bacterium]|nr:CCA tRNA nucleotidyltransferase [Geminicoccaceae bacterium]
MSENPEFLSQERVSWLRTPESAVLFDRIAGAGGRARFVGGCVRDALLDRVVSGGDIDIVTSLLPQAVMALFDRSIPTGLKHGTVTVLLGRASFEVTTLRRDTACDGRHAVVEYTGDFAEDAARRDFTINAMSCEPDGRIHDYFGGREDLRAGRLRFVGDPATRIREDYLRILRLFRFLPRYAREPLDPAIVDAVASHLGGLDRLSGERIAAEIRRMLAYEFASGAIAPMMATGVFTRIFGGDGDLAGLQYLDGPARGADWLTRAVVLVRDRLDPASFCERLRFSRQESDDLVFGCTADLPPLGETDAALRAWAYGIGAVRARLLLLVAYARQRLDSAGLDAARAVLDDFRYPAVPVSGKDLLALGMTPGPAVGKVLRDMEQQWIDSDFTLGREDLLASI